MSRSKSSSSLMSNFHFYTNTLGDTKQLLHWNTAWFKAWCFIQPITQALCPYTVAYQIHFFPLPSWDSSVLIHFFYWLGCFTTFHLHLRGRLWSISYKGHCPNGLKFISSFAVFLHSHMNSYQQHLTLQYSSKEPSDCIYLPLQGLSWNVLSRSMLHDYPVHLYIIPKHQRAQQSHQVKPHLSEDLPELDRSQGR